jgi:putative transposase
VEEKFKTFGKRRSLRLPGFDYHHPGPYHVTLGTYERQPFFTSPELVAALREELASVAASAGAQIYAYCFMPDHLHILLVLSGTMDLVEFVRRFKGRSTRVFWQHGGKGKLWQRGFYDHILRAEEGLPEVARYILANPVRAGLAQDFRSYFGSGSFVFRLEDL